MEAIITAEMEAKGQFVAAERADSSSVFKKGYILKFRKFMDNTSWFSSCVIKVAIVDYLIR